MVHPLYRHASFLSHFVVYLSSLQCHMSLKCQVAECTRILKFVKSFISLPESFKTDIKVSPEVHIEPLAAN